MGLRAGELSGLMWSDVDLKNSCIKIRREVVCMKREDLESNAYKEMFSNGGYTILPDQDGKKWVYVLLSHTKTHRERVIELPTQAAELLKAIPKTGLYVFANDKGKILTLRQINTVLEDACVHLAQAQGAKGTVSDLRKTVKIKRSHKIRKTYASVLSAAGIPIDRIREYLGHSNISTTLGYLYDPLTTDERRALLNEAFSSRHPKNDSGHPKKSVDF